MTHTRFDVASGSFPLGHRRLRLGRYLLCGRVLAKGVDKLTQGVHEVEEDAAGQYSPFG